ncbi:DMT family transporter [Nonomuraea sp. NEAU-A123]|uniref:DMT family transporter n=1 Tax=Nonomuraea sp. NEAU-A123 TaxID=2839649 RepID=UPI001BE41B3B|nr:EamA family transporter [Nonomuraea sp. NEAU-A123]MBT2235385.1 EamA family transporter [Nonomuraea sp. NEAU-A123]
MTCFRTPRIPSNALTALAGAVVVVSWASAFPAIRLAAPELGVAGLSLVRLLVAAVVLLALAPVTGLRLPARRDLPLVIACGVFGMAAYQGLLNWGELHVPAGTASIIVAGTPLVSIAIAAGAFGERLTIVKIAGSAVAIAGIALVSTARSDVSVTTTSWIVIAAAVVQGIYHPLTKPLLRRYTGLEVATYGMVVGAALTVPFVGFAWNDMTTADGSAWWSAVYLGVVPSALGFVMWGYTVARVPVATSTSLLYLVPAFAILIAYVWLGETPKLVELFGGIVVIAGVGSVTLGDRLLSRVRRPQMAVPEQVPILSHSEDRS